MFEEPEYGSYFLSINPFPSDASFNKDSGDRRLNGSIFNDDIFKEELNKLSRLMKRGMNLIYCQNVTDFVYGVGKSAIIAHGWRSVKKMGDDISTVFIRCQQKSTAQTLCTDTMREWHRQGELWNTVKKCVLRYIDEVSDPEITAEGAQMLFEKEWPIDHIDLRSYLVWNPDRLIRSLTNWVCSENQGIQNEIATFIFETYLSYPAKFLTDYSRNIKKISADEIDLFHNLLLIMQLADFRYHYLFFDQFEDAVHGLSGKKLIEFSSGMRRLLEVGTTRMSIVVTLHPGAALTLDGQDAQDFRTLAPLDSRHQVDVGLLEIRDAESLVNTYMDAFREGDAPHPLYPFTSEAIRAISEASDGQIRGLLTGLNLAIEEGVEADYPEIDLDFVKDHHENITGMIHPDHIGL